MQPRNPLVDVYDRLTSEVVAHVTGALPTNYLLTDKPDPLGGARVAWLPVPRLLASIKSDIQGLGEEVFAIAVHPDLKAEAKNRRLSDAAQSMRARIDQRVAEVQQHSGRVLSILRELAYPPRPQPRDATQEAALSGIKADTRMILDPAGSGEDVLAELKRLLGRALADGDHLAAWLYASSTWPEDYVGSRGFDSHRGLWDDEAARILDVSSPPALAEARRAYRAVSHPQRGLPVLDVVFTNTLHSIISEVADWRPNFSDPEPISRQF